MAKASKGPYWQICMNCDRRVYSAEPQVCDCLDPKETKMIPAADHPDNDVPKPSKADAAAKPGAGTSTSADRSAG
jgi:hypothetical protein